MPFFSLENSSGLTSIMIWKMEKNVLLGKKKAVYHKKSFTIITFVLDNVTLSLFMGN